MNFVPSSSDADAVTVSAETLRGNANKWSLADDDRLLTLLKTTADCCLDSMGTTERRLDEVLVEISRADTRFRNVHNGFLALSSAQFIENRVYDDDEVRPKSEPAAAKATSSKAEREAAAVAAVTTAMQSGRRLLATHFHRIDVRPQDFDEDDDPHFRPPPVYEPHDFYINRNLPHIIGSRDFLASPCVGLTDDLLEEEAEDFVAKPREPDQESVVVDLIPPNVSRVSEAPPRHRRFADDEQLERSAAPAPPTAVTPVEVVERAPSDSSGLFVTTGGPAVASVPSGESDEPLFGGSPPPVPDSQLFGGPPPLLAATGGGASGGRDLRSELEARLSAGNRAKAVPIVQNHSEESPDDEADLFANWGQPPPLPAAKTVTVRQKSAVDDDATRTGGIFDSDEEEDLFSAPKSFSKPVAQPTSSNLDRVPPPETQAQRIPVPKDAQHTPPPTQVPQVAVPIQRPSQPPSTAAPSAANKAVTVSAAKPATTPDPKNIFADDESDEDDIFAAVAKPTANKQRKTAPKETTVVPPNTKSNNIKRATKPKLFGSDESGDGESVEDLFAPPVIVQKQAPTATAVLSPVAPRPSMSQIPPATDEEQQQYEGRRRAPFGGVSLLPGPVLEQIGRGSSPEPPKTPPAVGAPALSPTVPKSTVAQPSPESETPPPLVPSTDDKDPFATRHEPLESLTKARAPAPFHRRPPSAGGRPSPPVPGTKTIEVSTPPSVESPTATSIPSQPPSPTKHVDPFHSTTPIGVRVGPTPFVPPPSTQTPSVTTDLPPSPPPTTTTVNKEKEKAVVSKSAESDPLATPNAIKEVSLPPPKSVPIVSKETEPKKTPVTQPITSTAYTVPPAAAPVVSTVEATKKPPVTSIFESDDEEDIFASQTPKETKATVKEGVAGPLFDDTNTGEFDDIFAEESRQKPTAPRKIEKAATAATKSPPVSATKTTVKNDSKKASAVKSLFDNDSDSDLDIFK